MGNLALTLGSVTSIMDEVAISGSGSVVYSDAFTVEQDENFSVFLVASGSAPHIQIGKCYNPDDESPPDLTMWADHDELGDSDTFIGDFTQTTWSVASLILKYSVWVKFKCTGLGTNGADTLLSMKLVRQSKQRV